MDDLNCLVIKLKVFYQEKRQMFNIWTKSGRGLGKFDAEFKVLI